jgi:endonuclease YncB( thermonuclease family)
MPAPPSVSAEAAPVAGTPAEVVCELAPGGSATVAVVIDGDTLSLSDGRVVRLSGIEAPKPHLARPGGDATAISETARQELDRLTRGATVELRFDAQQTDRHDRVLAQLHLPDGTWIQEAMVAGGFARVHPLDGDLSCLGGLLAREGEARGAHRGIWRGTEFAVIRADDPSLIERKGLYVLVVGRVVSVGRGNRVDFLNFGRYWRRDFTVLVGAPVSARLTEKGLPVEELAGRRVLVRGVIGEGGGPAIRLNDPGEIEILDDE